MAKLRNKTWLYYRLFVGGSELAWGIVFPKYGNLAKTETGPFIFPDGEFANETDKVSFGNCEIV